MKKLLSLFTALLLCTAMWGATTYKTFYKVQGALYQGINEEFKTGGNLFAPSNASVTYTTFDGNPANWYNNGDLKKSKDVEGASSYTAKLGDGSYYKYEIRNYSGYDDQTKKINYIYGTSSNDYSLRTGSGTMYMMSMANGYAVCTESSTADNVGKYSVDNKYMLTLGATDAKTYGTSMKYGTNFSYAKNGGLIFAYEMLVDNPGEMYIDYIVLPIYASSKDNTMDIADMIPEEAELTLTLYSIDLTLADDGKYTYDRKTPSITTVKATAKNFKADGDNNYRGTVKFTPKNPLLISGDFVARLTWSEGCEFGLITDDNNLQNFTTFYLWKDEEGKITKSYMWTSTSANASISYHAMFPVLEKKDKIETLEFASTGEESKEVAIKSNINPSTSKDFTIDFGGADWISMTEITYSDGEYKLSGTDTLKFKAEPNTTGKTREATITLKHHGKELKYTVSQESMPSAFYEVPANAFFAGMTETGDTAAGCKTFYLPYNYGQEYTFKSEEEGTWTKEKSSTTDKVTECSYLNRTMKDSCHTPLFAVDEKVGYQYGASGESFDEKLYFHIGDSVMHYMTPARLYGEYGKLTNYLRSEYNVGTHSTIGVYFDNKDVMYIDGISIPVKNSASGATEASLFPTGSKITVNIYEAPGIVARSTDNKSKRSSTCKKTIELKSNNYQKYSDDQTQRGALSTTFDPIVITGPFVVELINDGCVFTVYSSTEKENKWGYYIDNNEEVYPATYTPLISVHAMFPVLYPKAGEGESLNIDNIPAKGVSKELGGRPIRNIYANCKYEAEKNGWSRIKPDFITFNFSNSKDYATWYFTIMPNTTGAVREGDVTFKFRGKELTYHVTQEAPTLTPREGMDNKQTFEIPLQDDTVHINGDKVTKVYLESDVSLKDTINVTSEKGLTKIVKWFGSENGKYYVYFIFTRAKYVKEDTNDKITVSFKNNPDNKYEYTILHKGAGKLSTNHNYRTIVFGPQGSRRGLFVNDKGELQKDYFINIKAKIPANKILYIANKNRFYDTGFAYGEQGTANEYLQLCPKTKSNTETILEEDLRILIPNVDTITFHLIQEAKARVWQLFGDLYTEMEVGNKGGKAHFKNDTETVMTLFSNTQVTADEISFTYTNETDKEWVHPSAVIKPSSKLTKDTVILTFNVDPWNGIESRSTNITITVQGKDFVIPLTQKTFGITLSHQGDIDTLVVPVAGGKAFWKGTNHPDLYVEGTEAYGDNLLQVTYPDGVEITRQASMYNTGRKRTTFTFSKTGTVTEDWSDSIFISFDSINEAENFEYHFKDTIIITQAAPKVWLADDQQPLVIAAEGGESNEFTIWSNMNIPSKDWTVTQKPEWLGSVSGVSSGQEGGNYYRTLKTSAAANTGTEKREGKITIKHTTLTNLFVEINVSQDPLTTYTRTVTAGNWGTICLPYAAASFSGAEMYSIAGKTESADGIYLDQVNTMKAGEPYIFKATANQIEVNYYAIGDATPAKNFNGLYGYIYIGEGDEDFTVPEGNYIVYNNALYLVDSKVTIASNRAYIKYSEVETPSQAPQIRRVAMPINGAPANMLQVNDTKQPVKILRDGHIVILRDNKEYNILGQSK